MSIRGLPAGRRAIEANLMPHTVSTTTRSPNVTSACGRSATLRGVAAEAEGVRTAEGRYVLTLPFGSTLTLLPEEEITFADVPGRLFRVVGQRLTGSIPLVQRYDIAEVGR